MKYFISIGIIAVIGIFTYLLMTGSGTRRNSNGNNPATSTTDKTPSTSDTSTSKKADIPDDVILIGIISSKTGSASIDNFHMFAGARYAAKEINQAGGILGKKIFLLEYDNKSTPLDSRAAAKQAVKDNVLAVIGCLRSSHSLAAGKVLQEAKVIMISPESTNPKVTLVGDYIFRACFIDSFQGKVLAAYARNDMKAKTAAAITNTNRVFSMGLTEIFKDNFTKLGGKFLWSGDYLDKETDYKPILEKIKKLSPDVVFIPSESRESGYIIKQARKMGLKCKFIGPDSWGDAMYDSAGDAADGGAYSNHWHKLSARSKNIEFVEGYEKEFGSIPRAVIPLTYDAMYILKEAIVRTGKLDRKSIRDSLATTKDFDGVTGAITFDENRNPTDKSAVIMELKNGKAVFVKSVKP